jgi:hypothetical protein
MAALTAQREVFRDARRPGETLHAAIGPGGDLHQQTPDGDADANQPTGRMARAVNARDIGPAQPHERLGGALAGDLFRPNGISLAAKEG